LEPTWRFGKRFTSSEMARAIAYIIRADPRLKSVVEKVGRLRLRSGLEPFEALMVSIIFQQLAGSAAEAIMGRFKNLYGDRFPTPPELLATDVDRLRRTGLSRRKVEYLKDLAGRVAGGDLDLGSLFMKGDEEVISMLCEVKGIGRWTAQMFLIFPLGRQDVLPTGDLGIRAAVMKLYELDHLPSEREVAEIGSKWHPYCTVASLYLWRMGELKEGKGGA